MQRPVPLLLLSHLPCRAMPLHALYYALCMQGHPLCQAECAVSSVTVGSGEAPLDRHLSPPPTHTRAGSPPVSGRMSTKLRSVGSGEVPTSMSGHTSCGCVRACVYVRVCVCACMYVWFVSHRAEGPGGGTSRHTRPHAFQVRSRARTHTQSHKHIHTYVYSSRCSVACARSLLVELWEGALCGPHSCASCQ